MRPFIPIILSTVISILYLLVTGVVLIKRSFRQHTIRLLLLFLMTSAMWESLHSLWQLVKLFATPNGILTQLPIQGILLLAFLYFQLSRAFLRHKETASGRWAWGIILMAVVLFFRLGILLLLPSAEQLGLIILIFGWASFTSGVGYLTLRVYRQAPGAKHRNRIKYWFIGLCLMVAGDVFLFADHEALGSMFRLAATLVVVYAMLNYQLFDVSQLMRHTLNYLAITMITLISYCLGFLAMQYGSWLFMGRGSLIAALTIATIMAFSYKPFLILSQRMIDRLLMGRRYDPNLMVRQYSISISNILRLEHLAVVALDIIRQTMEIRHGTLFLVYPPKEDDDEPSFHLEWVKSRGKKGVTSGDLSADNPMAVYLCQERRLLTQYELDMLPQFTKIDPEEHAWLASLNVDVYLPIYANNEWIGLLALGPKISRQPYFDNDLLLLSTLADQTAVALQNARLVEDLVKLNQEIKQANLQLKELDNLKSAFIGVITHELRTPLINIDFSVQLLERHGTAGFLTEQREQLERLKLYVTGAEKMINNLINFATFLSKRGELQLTRFNIPKLINEAIGLAKPMAANKKIALQVDIPPDLPSLLGDREKLMDALSHLINNAVKFTNSGGQIWIRCHANATMMRFEIQDTGLGVPADKLPMLWDGFTQMSDPLLRGTEGLGLGLAIVKYVAIAHGGEVFAESEVGVGSTFGFQISLGSKN